MHLPGTLSNSSGKQELFCVLLLVDTWHTVVLTDEERDIFTHYNWVVINTTNEK